MDEIKNEQEVFVLFIPQMFGLPVSDGWGITKGIIINNTSNGVYNVAVVLDGYKSIQQINKENIHTNIKSALDKFTEYYGKPTTANSSN